MRLGLLAFAALAASCHLALGLEEAVEVEATGGGGTTSCQSAAQCDDENGCTADSCDGSVCHNDAVPDGDAPPEGQSSGNCKRVVCAGGVADTVNDTDDIPADDNDCTDDRCDGDEPTNTPHPGGTPCASDGGIVCSGTGLCVECFDDDQCTASEHCGGLGVAFECGCTPTIGCGAQTCGAIQDPVCDSFVFCDNDAQDGNETDIDCGGSPATCNVRCNEGDSCLIDADCGVDSMSMPLVCPAGTCVPM